MCHRHRHCRCLHRRKMKNLEYDDGNIISFMKLGSWTFHVYWPKKLILYAKIERYTHTESTFISLSLLIFPIYIYLSFNLSLSIAPSILNCLILIQPVCVSRFSYPPSTIHHPLPVNRLIFWLIQTKKFKLKNMPHPPHKRLKRWSTKQTPW